jgi:hypothetical protein
MESSINWPAVAADAIVLLHFAFVLFVLFGGVLLIWWRRLVWLHLPAALWGMIIEFNGWICPLTPYENKFRQQAGLEMYDGDFVMRYIMPILYPEDLTRTLQIIFGVIVLLVNTACYLYVFRFRKVDQIRD